MTRSIIGTSHLTVGYTEVDYDNRYRVYVDVGSDDILWCRSIDGLYPAALINREDHQYIKYSLLSCASWHNSIQNIVGGMGHILITGDDEILPVMHNSDLFHFIFSAPKGFLRKLETVERIRNYAQL